MAPWVLQWELFADTKRVRHILRPADGDGEVREENTEEEELEDDEEQEEEEEVEDEPPTTRSQARKRRPRKDN